MSMTGFGSAQIVSGGHVISVECRSVNSHRGLEVRFFSPRGYHSVEQGLVSHAKKCMSRGRVEIRIDVESRQDMEESADFVDSEQFHTVSRQLRSLQQSADLSPALTVTDVLAICHRQSKESDVTQTADLEAVTRAGVSALDVLVANRSREGAVLAITLAQLIDDAERQVALIDDATDGVQEESRERISRRVLEILAAHGAEVDEARMWQEIVYLVDRADISEEIQRAKSHLVRLSEMLDEEEERPRGRELDFYLQELMREANTMGSKSSTTTITDAVIQLKSTSEKLREQAANVE
jgi:uncharacterized protein (TIGR00255 family)